MGQVLLSHLRWRESWELGNGLAQFVVFSFSHIIFLYVSSQLLGRRVNKHSCKEKAPFVLGNVYFNLVLADFSHEIMVQFNLSKSRLSQSSLGFNITASCVSNI